jgi:hypothetical protein
VNTNSKAMGNVGNDVIQRVSVCSTAKQDFAMVAAKNDMVALPFPSVITSAGNMKSRRSWHPCRYESKGRQTIAIDVDSSPRKLCKWPISHSRHHPGRHASAPYRSYRVA